MKINLGVQPGRKIVTKHYSALGDCATTVIYWDNELKRHEEITIETINPAPSPVKPERQRNWPSKETLK